MFSINIYLRFALIAVCLGGGLILAFTYGFWYAFPFFLVGIILLAGYFLFGTIQSAAMLLQAQDIAGAEKRLDLTIKPDWLYSVNRGMYYMLKGQFAMQRGDTDGCEKWLGKAQEVGFNSDNEKAMVYLQLMSIHAQKNRWPQAQNLFRQIKEMNVTVPDIKNQIKEIEKAMAQRGQAQQMGRQMGGGAMQPGGKRPRPKIR